MPFPDTSPLPALGLGILSWHGYDSLAATLQSYKAAGFLDLFAEKIVFLPEITPQGQHIAAQFEMTPAGTPENQGIMRGFENMARAMTSDYILLVENDFQLTVPLEPAHAALTRALKSLMTSETHVWRFRHITRPGDPWMIHKPLRYWPRANAPFPKRCLSALRRLCRPDKAFKFRGATVFIRDDAPHLFPDQIKQTDGGDFLVRSDILNWSNNPFLIKRDFFLNTVIPMAEKMIAGRMVNGFPSLETELNRGTWWRQSKFWIGISNPGLFTHVRLKDRGY